MADVRDIGVVGAGFMGSGIAESAARAGLRVRVYEPSEAPLAQSRKRIAASVERAVRGGKIEPEAAGELQERITFSTELDSLHGSELVIEAIVEDFEVKRKMFRLLDDALDDAVILASNTSSIPIAGLAAATHRPQRVLGLHFFSPVPVMKLVAGHPMGPLQLCDFIGLDVLYAVCDSLYEEFKRAEYAPPPLMKRMVALGHLGRKTGRGFYVYSK